MDSRILTVSYTYVSSGAGKPVPCIRLQGKWLKKLDFNIGDKVLIGEAYGRIVIMPIDSADHIKPHEIL